jgi:hypothetical protein
MDGQTGRQTDRQKLTAKDCHQGFVPSVTRAMDGNILFKHEMRPSGTLLETLQPRLTTNISADHSTKIMRMSTSHMHDSQHQKAKNPVQPCRQTENYEYEHQPHARQPAPEGEKTRPAPRVDSGEDVARQTE